MLTNAIKYLFFILFFCICSLAGSSQTHTIDSLLTLLKTDKSDTSKVAHLNKLSREYLTHGEYDIGLKYSNEALAVAGSISKSELKNKVATTYTNIGNIYFYKGNYSAALKNHLVSLTEYEKIDDKQGVAASYNNMGAIYWKQGNYPNAMKNFLSALEIGEEIHDKNIISKAYNNIGLIYEAQEKYTEALKNHYNSLAIKKEIDDKRGIAMSYNNIGNIYYQEKKFNAALQNHEAALKIRKEIGDRQGVVMSLNNLGINYQNNDNYPEALANYKMALDSAEKIHDKYGIAISLTNLSVLQIRLNQLKDAKDNLNYALLLSKELGDKERIKNIYLHFSQIDTIQKNWESAYKNYELYVKYKDTLDNEQTKKKIIENSMNHEFRQKEAIAKAEQDKKDALAKEQQQQQKVIIYFITIGLLLTLLLAFFIYRSYKQKQKDNTIILQQKAEVEQQQKLTEEKSKLLAEKHKEITDSINYAKRIQRALLKEEELVSFHLPEHFIFFMPKDVVSGDFFWNFERKYSSATDENPQQQTTEYWYSCVADCTGHGVPGAMMSMLGMGLLSDVTGGDTLLTPAEILDRLRSRIIRELSQSGKDGENKDGMDASLFRLNRQTNELYWAGANNSLYLFRNNELTEVKGDKQPVAYHPVMKPFTNHVFQLQPGDICYLITDGYADQFGGPKGKKFKYKQMEELLASISQKPVKEQKAILKHTFLNWKGDTEQTDDVTIAGLRV